MSSNAATDGSRLQAVVRWVHGRALEAPSRAAAGSDELTTALKQANSLIRRLQDSTQNLVTLTHSA